jgi:uncharacterized protein (TIGR02145 family)
MKNILILVTALFSLAFYGQVGIGTINPASSSILDLTASNKALLVTRVATTGAIASPLNGMIIYDISSECFKSYENNAWTGCLSSVPTTPPINPVGAGSLSGKTCFDIALGNDNTNACGPLSARTANQSNFTNAATHTQTYTFTPSGTVSNVRFVYINTNGSVITAISGNNTGSNISTPVVATVNYNTNLNTLAAGLTNANPLTADIYVIYNDGATNNGIDRQIKLTTNVKDCACCGAMISPTVWKEFLCHNLGADTSLDPHVPVVGLQGAYIQWGKRGPNTTGDSRVDWQTAANNAALGFAAAPTAGNANVTAISGWNAGTSTTDYSWYSVSGVKTANDPCPTGYRVPTSTEWNGVFDNNSASRTGTYTTSNTSYGSALHYGPNASTKLLTLPSAGYHDVNDGSLSSRGGDGYYWGSTGNGGSTNAYAHRANSSTILPAYNYPRGYAFSIRCIQDTPPPAATLTINCAGVTSAGTLTVGTAASGVTMSIPYTGGNSGFLAGSTVVSTGVTGLTATYAGSSNIGTSGNIVFNITGTPSATGIATFAINIGGQSCNLTRNVAAPSNPAGSGSFSGKTCFDIALGNDNTNSCGPLTGRTANQSNFTNAATHTQSYTFTPSGTVSNVRFLYINTNGSPIISISGGNTGNNISTAVVATVNYNTNLNTLAAGLTNANPLTGDIYVVYNDGATNNGIDRQIKLTANIKDCACCVVKVSATVYKEFLCHNLGANTSLDPHVPVVGLQGAYIQWGKRGPNTTGDSRVDWVNAANNGALGFAAAPTGANANDAAIAGWSTTNAADNAWRTAGGAKTANDPCPAGYRVPTSAEWVGVDTNNTVTRTGSFTESTTHYGSALHYGPNASTKLLTLPAAGFRGSSTGQLSVRGNGANYWSSTENGTTGGFSLFFNNVSQLPSNGNGRLNAMSIRCIQE